MPREFDIVLFLFCLLLRQTDFDPQVFVDDFRVLVEILNALPQSEVILSLSNLEDLLSRLKLILAEGY